MSPQAAARESKPEHQAQRASSLSQKPTSGSAHPLLGLQDMVGNRGVQRLALPYLSSAPAHLIQRACAGGCGGTCPACEEEELGLIQRQASSAGAGLPAPPRALPPGSGQPLDASTRADLELRFGRDLGDVRVHADAAAAEAAKALRAEAFTVGHDIYFAAGRYQTGSPAGQRLLAHELVHTIQQGAASGDAVQRSSRVSQPDDPLEREADRVAGQVAVGDPVSSLVCDGAARQVQRSPDLLPSLGDIADAAKGVVTSMASAGEEAVDWAAKQGSAAVSAVTTAAGAAASWVTTTAGSAALSAATSLVALLGGTVTITGAGLVIKIPHISLLDSLEVPVAKPPSSLGTIPLLAGGVPLGPVVLAGALSLRFPELPSMEAVAYLGPGYLRDITIVVDPLGSHYSAAGVLYLAGAISSIEIYAGSLRAEAGLIVPAGPVPVPIPLVALEGGVRATFRRSALGGLQSSVVLAYTRGAITLSLFETLKLGALIELDVDAFLQSEVFDFVVCEHVWPFYHWETGRAEEYNLPISIGYGTGGPPVSVGPITSAPISPRDIEVAINRKRPETRCKTMEEIIAELCRLGILPAILCPPPTAATGIGPVPPPPVLPPGAIPPPGVTAAKSNRLRVQLQHSDDDIVPAVAIERDASITVAEGHQAVDTIMGRMSDSVFKACKKKEAGDRMKKTISGYPPQGVDAVGNVARKNCAQHPDYKRGIRLDLENRAGKNFVS
jgi:hypothetical protein